MPLYLAAAVDLVEKHQEKRQETEGEGKATTPRRRKIPRQVWVREWLTSRQRVRSVVAGLNWRQEAPADFRATLMPSAEYKMQSKENDRCIKMLSWSPYMETFTAEIPRKGSANIFKNMLV
ncbi:hypothetical protein PoB_003539800 [Plakobranchus ocellatus]|uniref:Uncharacterized protein n=1 Tax=Plakobranchus ocellatus TaxID=259542 RepID=A0AAV4AQP4_9GAST|nr:hypothetical protein PoB_003539800 [Plakobranchus ocellatus]